MTNKPYHILSVNSIIYLTKFFQNFYTPGIGYNSIYLPYERQIGETYFNNVRVNYANFFDWDGDVLEEEGMAYFYYNPILPDKTREIAHGWSAKIYPNPATSEIIVDGANLKSYSFIKLYDINGKFISKWQVNSNRTSIPVSNLSSGLYILEMQSDKGVIREKVVKK